MNNTKDQIERFITPLSKGTTDRCMPRRGFLKTAAGAALGLACCLPAVRAEETGTDGKLQPFGNVPGRWNLASAFSDEFDAAILDANKWDADVPSWADWSWDSRNALQGNGQLRLRMIYEPHMRGSNQLFYKSGIIRSKETITYGYFEARIKGCRVFPGACPAFWIYSHGPETGTIRYSEVDFVEMEQNQFNAGIHRMDCNLHTRVVNEDGKVVWIRPKQNPALCQHVWMAPWDPRDNFHIYAGEVTPETVTWYIDGQKVATAENRYWHLPMNVTLSLGLRPPYERWVENGSPVAVAKNSTGIGFPTEMTIDYVRVWKPSKT